MRRLTMLCAVLWCLCAGGCDDGPSGGSSTSVDDCCPYAPKQCSATGCAIECDPNFGADCSGGTKYTGPSCECYSCEDTCEDNVRVHCPTLAKPEPEIVDCAAEGKACRKEYSTVWCD